MWTLPTTVFGLMSLMIITMAGVIIRLYNDNKILQNKIDASQLARLQDAAEMVDKVTVPLSSLSQTMPLIYSKLADSKKG